MEQCQTGRLQGKVAMITGAAQGIGLAFAETYAPEGALVVIADIDERAADEAAMSIGDQVSFVTMDVADQASIEAAVATVEAQHDRIDILINLQPLEDYRSVKKSQVGASAPIGRMATAADLVGMAVFLASGDADYIVAQTYNVDGGNWMS